MAKIRKQETLDYTALKRELKSKGPENLYMLWGPEDYLIADFVSSLRDICVSAEMRDFDVKPLLSRKCYLPLEGDVLFQTAHVSFGVVEWANGLDIDPEWLYEDSVPVK